MCSWLLKMFGDRKLYDEYSKERLDNDQERRRLAEQIERELEARIRRLELQHQLVGRKVN